MLKKHHTMKKNTIVESTDEYIVKKHKETKKLTQFELISNKRYSLNFELDKASEEVWLKSIEADDYTVNYVNIVIPAKINGFPVTRIDNDCYLIGHIVSLTLPETLKTIGRYAFFYSFLNKITIPQSVTHIEEGAFYGCFMTSIEVDKKNEVYDSRNDCNAIICTKENKLVKGCKNTIIPNSIVEIGVEAFAGCYGLSHITIPNSVIKIDLYAFEDCQDLYEINIPSKVSEIEIESFSRCIRLLSIKVSKHNKVYDSRGNCDAIIETATNTIVLGCAYTVIPNTVTKIGQNAFEGVQLINSIRIPDSITTIDSGAFFLCSNLEVIALSEHIEEIGEQAFYNTCLKRLEIPNSVKSIGSLAFPSKTLTSIKVAEGNSTYDSRNDCNAIIETRTNKLICACINTIIPNSVTEIGEYAYCDVEVKEIAIPSSVTNIHENAFGDNKNIQKIYTDNPSLFENVKLGDDVEIIDTKLRAASSNDDKVIVASDTITNNKLKGIFGFGSFFDTLSSYLELMLQTENVSINSVLYSSLQYCITNLYDAKFVKFINVFNNTDRKDYGNAECYIDLIHSYCGSHRIAKGKRLITDRRNRVDIKKNVLEDLAKLTISIHRQGPSLKRFEYCPNKDFHIENTYQNVIYKTKDSSPRHHDYKFGKMITLAYRNDFVRFLKNIENCYTGNDDGVTNYFYLASRVGQTDYAPIYNDLGSDYNNDDLWKYSTCALIGVDCHKTDAGNIKRFIDEFQEFIDQLSNCIVKKVYDNTIRQTAVEGSIAKAIARNMRHNIGSHVLSHAEVYRKMSDFDIIKKSPYVSSFNFAGLEQDGYRQQIYFDQYLNNRMDYISETSLCTPNMYTLRYIYSDIFKEFDKVRILLKHISGVPDFKYTFSLKYNGKELDENNDIPAAFSNDQLGAQALYVIIENIIRNSSKHAQGTRDGVNVFTIEFKDNVQFPEYYAVEIDNGISEPDINVLVRNQNKLINTSILDKDNNLRNFGMGLLEMTTSTAFLRQINIAQIDSYEYRFENTNVYRNSYRNLILLKAFKKNGALAYRFFIPKYKEIVLVGNWNITQKRQSELLNIGIQIVNENDFAESMKNGETYSHQFLIYRDNISNATRKMLSEDNDLRTLLPIRKLKISSSEAAEIIEKLNKNADREIVRWLKNFAWTHYCKDMGQVIIGTMVNPDKTKDCDQIVFINHATEHAHRNAVMSKSDNHELWVENLSSYTQSKLPRFNELSKLKKEGRKELPMTTYLKNIDNPIRYELIEAYRTKVLVLDERIMDYLNNSYEGRIRCSELFKSTNVLVPPTSLDPNSFDEDSIKTIEDFINSNSDKNTFVLIHYGILERIYNRNEKTITERIEAWAKQCLRLVITSGRGSHSINLPTSVCFANLASVLNCFKENRCKYLINNLLYQSRRKHE